VNRNLVLAVLVASIAGAIAWVGGWLITGANFVLRSRIGSATRRSSGSGM